MDPTTAEAHTGTTILAVTYDGGVVLAADTRVTTGTYVSNRASDKISPLTDNAYLARSGSAADTQAVTDYVRHMLNQMEMEQGKEPKVRTVAQVAMQMNYQNKGANRGMGLSAAMICAGYDEEAGGQVYSLPIGGSMVQVPWAVDGSGSTYIWGYFDGEYKEGMGREEAEEFAKRGIALAMARDASSGGCCRLVTMDASGAKRQFFPHDQLPLILDEMPAPSGGIIV
mmetsp:Transcript_4793/g.16509  ORF Transcript_4793/g.16509 Transcript_4793/m.16509 type:complete len:227 (-) Transcript_4793:66-746(-)